VHQYGLRNNSDSSKWRDQIRQCNQVIEGHDEAMSDPYFLMPKVLLKVSKISELQAQHEQGADASAEAQRAVALAMERYPDNGIAMAAQAWSFMIKEEFASAAEWFEKALEWPEKTVEFEVEWISYLGICHWRMRDWKRALAGLSQARALSRNEPSVLVTMGTICHEIGDSITAKLCIALGAYFDGHQKPYELFAKMASDPYFADPDRLEASLRVVADPLDKSARVFRGEMMVSIESPKSALYDFLMADALAPRDLGLMVRIEEIQVKGLIAGQPAYDITRPTQQLPPDLDEFLTKFRQEYQARLLPREMQPLAFPVEKVFGPSTIIPSADPHAFLLHSIVFFSIACLVFIMSVVAIMIIGILAYRQTLPPSVFPRSEWITSLAVFSARVSGGFLLSLAAASLVIGCYWSFFLLISVQEYLNKTYPQLSLVWSIAFIFMGVEGIAI
jgi:tetratricopeptide (TPR) repeat protein